MSNQVIIPATVWVQLTKQITEINQAVAVTDLINREQACQLLGITSKTFSNYKIAYDSRNEYGVEFYSRKKLLGL